MRERSVPDHYRSTLSASTPAQRLAELTSLTIRLQEELDEAVGEKEKLEKRLARYQTLGGVSFGAIPVAQIWADFVLWEALLNSNVFLGLIELGTWNGGFSWWLWAQTQARNMAFYTFDSVVPEHRLPPNVFEKRDIFADAEKTADLIRLCEPCVVFCDNGNKPRELRTFAPELRHADSLLVAHDWGTEINSDDVPDMIEMVHEDFCVELGSISRVFRLRRTDA